MKAKNLLNQTLKQFIACASALLLLATPLFYLLTKYYYAEDMIDIIEAVHQGQPIPSLDLEEDIIQGIMLQFGLIAGVLCVALVVVVRLISRRMWKPFDETLDRIEQFKLEDEKLPTLPDSDIQEFKRLNAALDTLMKNNLASYRSQKEFTENASHELQTPLAIFQSKLDLLLQQPDLTEPQAEIIQSLYQVANRLSRLNRNLLLLAKIENNQYRQSSEIDIIKTFKELAPYLENLAEGITLKYGFQEPQLYVQANPTLLENLINNLIVNAVRHNRQDGQIRITVTKEHFTVSNTSSEPALDQRLIFNRFYKPSGEDSKGNGLGLAIVKSICLYHGWQVGYSYTNSWHNFTVTF